MIGRSGTNPLWASPLSGETVNTMTASEGSPVPPEADPTLHDLYGRWSKHAESGRLPSFKDMNFEKLKADFPTFHYFEVERRSDSTPRFVYRHASEELERVLGRKLVGLAVDELVLPHQVELSVRVYNGVVESRRPHYWMRMNTTVGNKLINYERLLLPVADDGVTVDGLIGVAVWLDDVSVTY